MRLSNRQPFGSLPHLDRLRLRRAAVTYARHGWAVAPGACLTGRRFSCGRPGCPIMGCHPAIESWEDDASTDPGMVALWWRRRPHAVLLATGGAFDVLEVPATLGVRAVDAMRWRADARGPVGVTPDGRWMFLVSPGEPLRDELAYRLDVVRHGPSSWIPAAPSRTPEGPVRWAVSPDRTQWRLPAASPLQAVLVAGLATVARRPVVTVPRQLSTSRRAA
jgi:hypothetical protein